jgi:hypothetical protein
MRMTRRRRPGGDDERQRQLTRTPRGQPQQTQGQLISPLSVVKQERKRLLIGQLDDQPPQRVHDFIAARARPARIRQRPVEREHAQPRRPTGH